MPCALLVILIRFQARSSVTITDIAANDTPLTPDLAELRKSVARESRGRLRPIHRCVVPANESLRITVCRQDHE
jgi:hypothetical protein